MHKCTLSISAIVIVLLSINFLVSISHATEEYAENTEKDCIVCHIDPLGGGDLTELGEGYLLSINPEFSKVNSSKKVIPDVIKLIAGYLHVITAFMWFGTILYVHLVLKPAYASKGLPRGEVKVGLVSMAVMAMTGIVLTYYKVPSIDLLVSSRFGILLLIKISLFTIMVVSALSVVLVIGPKLKKKKTTPVLKSGELTIDELGSFDGEDGRPAYIAFKGVVYDVSKSKLWKNGSHMNRHQAGTDLTDILSQAPHGEDKVLALPEISKLSTAQRGAKQNIHEKVFYFMAYMNLSFVFIITFILALWRWS